MRCILIVLIGATLIAGCSKHATSREISTWTPPQNPSPEKILGEADGDTRAGQYANALAKYVWFYENALKYDPSERGVRLSFALDSWATLGESYPPALDKLKAVRDEAEESVRQAKEPLNAYDDFIAINNTLRDYSRSLELFVWLDTNKPDLAKAIFERAQYYLIPALIEAKQYQLCGKYIDPNTSVDKILQLYRETTKHAIESNDTSLKNFEDQFLINRVTTIIALLSITDRKADAQQIVDRISKESDLPEFKPEIKKALDGEIPPQSP